MAAQRLAALTGRRIVVVGGGILGLAVADRLARDEPGVRLTVVEKEATWTAHQTGRNSGVVHSGVYYAAGSAKADMCRRGNQSMVEFARAHGVAVERTGKLIAAVDAAETGRLHALHRRAIDNGLRTELLDGDRAREHEPELRCQAALWVPSTAVVDYRGVGAALVRRLTSGGADLRLRTAAQRILPRPRGAVVATDRGDIVGDVVVNCAGLHADVLARGAGVHLDLRIVPFRGEYYQLRAPAGALVRGLIYPVPDPALPFLGVHLTRGVDGSVHAGPNAVLALAREGYGWTTVQPRELAASLAWPGLWRLGRRHVRTAAAEVARSLSLHRFGESLRRLVPAIADADLQPAPAGVRAQALRRDGRLVDDFVIRRTGAAVHVLNAPSPAATCAFEIAAHVATLVAAA